MTRPTPTRGTRGLFTGATSVVPLYNRLWHRVDMSGGLLACWPWLGAKSRKRAGTTRGHLEDSATGRHYLAHRLALCFAGEGLAEYSRPEHAAHRCHNRLCCNIYSHLYWATDAENREDRYELERRQARGQSLWEPAAWYHCERCGHRFLEVYAADAFDRPNCYRCHFPRVWCLPDLEKQHGLQSRL